MGGALLERMARDCRWHSLQELTLIVDDDDIFSGHTKGFDMLGVRPVSPTLEEGLSNVRSVDRAL